MEAAPEAADLIRKNGRAADCPPSPNLATATSTSVSGMVSLPILLRYGRLTPGRPVQIQARAKELLSSRDGSVKLKPVLGKVHNSNNLSDRPASDRSDVDTLGGCRVEVSEGPMRKWPSPVGSLSDQRPGTSRSSSLPNRGSIVVGGVRPTDHVSVETCAPM